MSALNLATLFFDTSRHIYPITNRQPFNLLRDVHDDDLNWETVSEDNGSSGGNNESTDESRVTAGHEAGRNGGVDETLDINFGEATNAQHAGLARLIPVDVEFVRREGNEEEIVFNGTSNNFSPNLDPDESDFDDFDTAYLSAPPSAPNTDDSDSVHEGLIIFEGGLTVGRDDSNKENHGPTIALPRGPNFAFMNSVTPPRPLLHNRYHRRSVRNTPLFIHEDETATPLHDAPAIQHNRVNSRPLNDITGNIVRMY